MDFFCWPKSSLFISRGRYGTPITLEELTRALKSMKMSKSPGLDVLHLELFQEV